MAREYKDSGIEWIGEIPKEWNLVRAKSLFAQRNSKGNESAVLLSATQKQGMMPQSLLEGVVQVNNNTDLQTFKTVHKNDYVISLRSFQGGFEMSNYEGVCSPAYQVFYNRIPINYSYFWFLFKSYGFVDKINSLTVGIREGKNIQYKDFANMLLAVPPLPEQEKIADYLDKVCGEADEMTALQEKMIEELKAYKQSIITEVVTKGLNPKAPMKNSGIDWIGEIPEHWKTTKIKKIATTNSGSTPRKISNSEGSNIVWIRTTDINDNIVYDSSLHLTNEEFSSASCPMLKSGTCVVAMYGGGGTIGKSGILGATATINQALCSMEVNDSYFAQYLFCVLKSVRYYWMKYAVGTRKDPNINQEIVRNLNIPFPLIEEQRQIASFLDTKCSEIDALIAIKQQKIAELKEYKKSVIYEYVTGKKEVV